MLSQAEQHIGFIHAFLEYPNGLWEEDWKLLRPSLASACARVGSEEFRKKRD